MFLKVFHMKAKQNKILKLGHLLWQTDNLLWQA